MSLRLPSTPQAWARVVGVLYLIIIAVGLFAEMAVRSQLIVPGDAAATATNILAHPTLYRLGIAADLYNYLSAIVVAVILYALLKPVDRHLALLMLMFNLAQDAIGGMNALNAYRALQLLGGAEYLEVFSQAQLQALALLSLRAHTFGFGVSLLFFGLSCLALGCLIYRSGFLPRALGVLMVLAGAAYAINSTLMIVAPTHASILLLLPAFVGELAFALWLTVKGVGNTHPSTPESSR